MSKTLSNNQKSYQNITINENVYRISPRERQKIFHRSKEIQQRQTKINELMQQIQSFKMLNIQLQRNNLTLLNNNALLQLDIQKKKQDIQNLTNNLNTAISNSNIYMKFSPRTSCLYSLQDQKMKNSQQQHMFEAQSKKVIQLSSKPKQKDDFLKPKILRQTQAKGFTQSRAQQAANSNTWKNNQSALYQSFARVQRTASLSSNIDSYIFLNGQKSKPSLSFMQNKNKSKVSESRDIKINASSHTKKKSFETIPIQLLHKRHFSSQQQSLNGDENKLISNLAIRKKKQDVQFGRNQISAYTSNEVQPNAYKLKFEMKPSNGSSTLDERFGNIKTLN